MVNCFHSKRKHLLVITLPTSNHPKPPLVYFYNQQCFLVTKHYHNLLLTKVESVLTSTISQFGRLDGVVNCAGSILLRGLHSTSAQDFHSTLETNLFTAFHVTKESVKVMKKGGKAGDGGSIVLCSSAVAQLGLPNHEAIAAAKVLGWTISNKTLLK